MKAEWLGQQLEALWKLLDRAEDGRDTEPGDAAAAAAAVARTTAAHHPAHIRLRNQDNVLLPTAEGRIWSLYGSRRSLDESGAASDSLHSVITQLLTLQPEAAGHLRCLAWGPGAADLLAAEAVELIGTKIGSAVVERVEIFCVGDQPVDKPSRPTLDRADRKLRGEQDALQLRYMPDLAGARRVLAPAHDTPAVHLALVTGLTEGGRRLQVDAPEVELPRLDAEVLFAPRVWQRPGKERRTLLMPPAASATGRSWLQLQNAVSDSWPEPDGPLEVPEVRTGTLNIRDQLVEIHELALWVATLDRYATRDSLEQALGRDQVAILHQERRLGGDSPLALVLSQKSGGPADRAIGRSLRIAGIVDNPDVALELGTDLRKVASQGYGILALQAATSGAGINELVGHVVAFSMLATTATPWPLPPGCRVLLVSLDEYRHWFSGKRADLLAIALDPAERGVHVAVIEVKARRSDETDAKAGALDQLVQTIAATRWAAYPDSSIQSRLWLNRIAEAAYSVARESKFRLDAAELDALESFRLGDGSLEWAGVGLVFRPNAKSDDATHQQSVAGDIVPVVLRSVTLTEELLRTATSTDLTQLRTVESERAPFQSTRVHRRPEIGRGAAIAPAGPEASTAPQAAEHGTKVQHLDPEAGEDTESLVEAAPEPTRESSSAGTRIGDDSDSPPEDHEPGGGEDHQAPDGPETSTTTGEQAASPTSAGFRAPVLGWDADTGDAVSWHPAGPPSPNLLQNGHVEIWGSSGMGKTQFVMSLLAQLTHHSGSKVGILDFKNDYSGDTGFPDFADAEFLDLWDGGAPYNPLALPSDSKRDIDAAVIEIRDTVEEATRAFTRMGVRQKSKLKTALENAYRIGRQEHRWPTLKTLGGQLDDDLAGVIGDLTEYDLFGSGEPLGSVIDRNVVFGLSRIPGNGQTTVFAAGFILSSLLLTVQNLPPVPNTIRYVAVVDEAHRVAAFKAIGTMIREGRSKGLSVVLATQQPLDLPDIVAANAQTKICFGLPDGPAATMAARKLDPHNARLPEQIRTLGVGEAYVSLRGGTPQLVRMAQAHRDAPALGLPALRHPQ
ncbi:helicase HerA-like domain-containing protein [uncultured Friedmanniella sp.]|uniref:ATP-binding protein n=1 Tax=uncultured Friedmanniella sp. TaxID=335381 RepID=UPI0035CCA22F